MGGEGNAGGGTEITTRGGGGTTEKQRSGVTTRGGDCRCGSHSSALHDFWSGHGLVEEVTDSPYVTV